MVIFSPSVLLFLLLISFVGWRLLRKASNDRNWKPDVAHVAYADVKGDTVHIKNICNNRYGKPRNPYNVIWEERTFSLSKLKRLWFLIEPFHPTVNAIAHTFLSFEFEDDFLAVSIEARIETGKSYSIVKGLFGEFEIIYRYGDERDFIVRRTNYMQHDVYLYPLITPPHEIKTLFLSMLAVTNKLVDKPRFYNSIFENCTSSLKAHGNRVRPSSFLPFIWAQVFPGHSDKILFEKGWIATDVPFTQLRKHYNISQKAHKYANDPDFSRKIRDLNG